MAYTEHDTLFSVANVGKAGCSCEREMHCTAVRLVHFLATELPAALPIAFLQPITMAESQRASQSEWLDHGRWA